MTQPNYDAIPVFSGRPMAAPAESGFFQPAASPAEGGLLATDQARAVAEVKAALVIAASRPRNELQARDRLLQACQRIGLASSAMYKYIRGGSTVTGPSIRLAETAARAWGNINYGFRELSRSAGISECEAFAWDLETNTKAVRQFTIRHRRDTRSGGYDITEERDIYELMANQAQRRVRAAILEIIPGDIIEDALDQCERTLSANVGNVVEAAKKLVDAFAAMGVTREAIEERLGHRIDAIQPAQILEFRKIYTSIKDGMSESKDWFRPVNTKENSTVEDPSATDRPAPQSVQSAAPQQPQARGRRKVQAAADQSSTSAEQPSSPLLEETGAAPQPSAEDGERQQAPSDDAPSAEQGGVPCPKTGKLATPDDCFYCAMHDNCPALS